QAEQVSDQDKAVHYSLYYEDFKNQNFQSALPNLKWVIENAPEYPRNDDRNFERLIETFEGIAANAGDEATAAAYLDSALVWYDESVAAMKETGIEFNEVQWQLRKGRFVQENAELLGDDIPSPAEIYYEAFEMAGCELDPYYIRFVIDDVVRRGEKQRAVNLTDEAEACYADNADLVTYLNDVRNNLFTSPEERMAFLESRLEQNPDDYEIASELFDIYLDLEYREEAAELGDRLVEMQESARTYRRLGELHLQDGDTERAISYYERALDMPGASDSVRRDILYNLGIAMQQDGSLSQARSYFRQAMEIDPNYGRAYIAIGDLYATAVSACGTFEREDRAVYWLAVDYYQRAKANDPSVASQADQKIATYRRSFPDQEALFFRNWEPGDSYRIDYGCYSWINETTTVKAP
ncbi:MAG: tetratricopeptide repeat protein, partial [Rhodothermales bacterium]